MKNDNEAELTALEDGVVERELYRIWSEDSRFTSLSQEEMTGRVTKYWIRKAGSTMPEEGLIKDIFKTLKSVGGKVSGVVGLTENPVSKGVQWISKKYGGEAAHRAAIETATQLLTARSASMGLADYHAFLKQTNLLPLAFDLHKNSAPQYQSMVFTFILNDLFMKPLTVTSGMAYAQSEATKGHEKRLDQHDILLKNIGKENLRLKTLIEGSLADPVKARQLMDDLAQGKGEFAELLNNQFKQFNEDRKMEQYAAEHIQNEKIQAEYKTKVDTAAKAAGLAVDVTAFIVGDVIGDHKLAQKISQAGGSVIGLGVSFASCFAPTPPTALLCAFGVASSFLGLVRSLSGNAQDPTAMMFDILVDMSKNVKKLVIAVDKMDTRLQGMDETMRVRFKETLEYAVYITNQMSEIRTSGTAIQKSVEWVTQEQFALYKSGIKIANVDFPVGRLTRGLQIEGSLLSGFFKDYIDLITWTTKISHDPSLTGLHMEGNLDENIRTMLASGRKPEDIIGAFAKFICDGKAGEEMASCRRIAATLPNPSAWFVGAHEFVGVLSALYERPDLLAEFSEKVPRFGEQSRNTLGYCDHLVEMRQPGEQLIAWHDSLSANAPLRKKLLSSYRIFLTKLGADIKERTQVHAKAPGSWAHTIQGHIDRLENENTAIQKEESRKLVVPSVHRDIPTRAILSMTQDQINACVLEWPYFYSQAVKNYGEHYQKDIERIPVCVQDRIQELKNIQTISPVTIVSVEPNHEISCILYPDEKNAKENQLFMGPITPTASGSLRTFIGGHEIHHHYFAAELLGVGEIKRKVITSEVFAIETYFNEPGSPPRLCFKVRASDLSLALSVVYHYLSDDYPTTTSTVVWGVPDPYVKIPDTIMSLNQVEQPGTSCPVSGVRMGGTVSSLPAFVLGNLGGIPSYHFADGAKPSQPEKKTNPTGEPSPHFADDAKDSPLEKKIKGAVRKKQNHYLEDTTPSATIDDTPAYLLQTYLHFTLGSGFESLSALSGFTLWTHKLIAEKTKACNAQLDNGKPCEELLTQIEASLQSLPNDEVVIDGLLQTTPVSPSIDKHILHGMDTTRHQLIGINFFEFQHCRRNPVTESEVDALKSECKAIGGQDSAAICESIFGAESTLFSEETQVCRTNDADTGWAGYFMSFFKSASTCNAVYGPNNYGPSSQTGLK